MAAPSALSSLAVYYDKDRLNIVGLYFAMLEASHDMHDKSNITPLRVVSTHILPSNALPLIFMLNLVYWLQILNTDSQPSPD